MTPRPGYAVKDINRHGVLDVEVELRGMRGGHGCWAWWCDGPRERIREDD